MVQSTQVNEVNTSLILPSLQLLRDKQTVQLRLGEEELKHRLRTHLIPYSKLAVGYEGLADIERRNRVKDDYQAFLSARAEILGKYKHLYARKQ